MKNSNNTNSIESLSNKKIIVTGGTGLIGRQIINFLTKINCKVTSVSLDNLELNKDCNYIYGDLTNYDFCKKITKEFDYAIHTAGIKGSVDVTNNKPASFLVPMLMMNTNFLEACRINKVKKVVFTSSIGAYSVNEILKEKDEFEITPPMDSFPGWAKRMAELQIKAYYKQYNTNSFVIVRPANVYGPGDNFDLNNAMVIPSLINKILNGDNPVKIWGDGSAIRDFIYSKDVAYGTILALIKGQNSQYYNIGSGKGISIKKLVETLNQILDFSYKFDSSKPSGASKRIMDITKAQKELKFASQTDLKTGLQETIEWYKNNKLDHLKKQNYFIND